MKVDELVNNVVDEIDILIEKDLPMPPSRVILLDRLRRDCVKYLEAIK